MPPGALTVTFTTPAEPAGVRAVIDDVELTVNDAAGVPPKETAEATHKCEPVIVTNVCPLVGPVRGLISIRAGA